MIRTSTNHVNDIIVDTTHINRIYADGAIIHGVTPPTPPTPVVTTPLVIGSSMRYFTIDDFSYGVNDTAMTTTKIAFLMNMGSQPNNSKIFCGPEPWNNMNSIGIWKENDSFAIKRTGAYWFDTAGTFSDYTDDTFWFVYDIKGQLQIYYASPTDTHYINNTSAFNYTNYSNVTVNVINTVDFFGAPDQSEFLCDSTIYRIIITKQDGIDQHLVPIEEGGVQYFKNLYTDDTYQVYS